MDIPKFKDVIQKLSFLRNYSSLILPVIITVVAVLLFVPTQLMSTKLKKQIERESISLGRNIQSLSESAVSRNQWEIEQEYQQKYERDANQTEVFARQSSQRPLLSYKIFPAPKDPSTLIFGQFGQQFRRSADRLIANINALSCPTEAELRKGLQGSSRQGFEEGTEKRSEVEATITDVLCREKAQSAFVYAVPTDLSGYEFWEEYEYTGIDAAVEDCWYWQLGYWVIEDIIDTIDSLNTGSDSVFTSPVKRLMAVNFEAGKKTDGGKAATRPSYVLSSKNAIAEPHTGRFCNDDIDVVHFHVVVVVDTKAILPFMQKLCSAKQHKFRGFSGEEQERVFKHNQITVLESNISPIDRENATHYLYRYGEDAVVELDLICEYVFDKKGYDDIKPELIKEPLQNTAEQVENVRR
ncbi:MAG: hypothetical protein PHY02_04515 [Phycisphaerae bacterium]|nr:hypothetical protein [Phycisphaerae bacterium]